MRKATNHTKETIPIQMNRAFHPFDVRRAESRRVWTYRYLAPILAAKIPEMMIVTRAKAYATMVRVCESMVNAGDVTY